MGKSDTPLLVFDFFSGTGSSTRAFEDAGDNVISFELDSDFFATENIDILELTAEYLIKTYGQPDFVWASPPCTAFSVASMGHHWISGGSFPQPRTDRAVLSQELVVHVRNLIHDLAPKLGYLIENPRGMLRKLPPLADLPRRTITYCQYGDDRMKPTDLWGEVPGWTPRPACANGSDCHIAAPRGSSTGTQGRSNAKTRSMVPYALGEEIRSAIVDQRSNSNG
jgi:hypothetical protein